MLLVCELLFSQAKTLQANKVSHPPIIDGSLDDLAWQQVEPATGFIQNFPNYGSPASQKTEVRVVYDNAAIYIGAHMYDDPALIRKQITARDEEQMKDLDYFSVFFDTYNDDQNGFQFLVTSSNVQTDARLAPNLVLMPGEYGDKTWDAVWESQVTITSDGWIVEMKIPYLSLRFAKKDIQTWGLQLLRSVRRNNEVSSWSPVNPNVNGFVNQFGELANLKEIRPPLRLNFSPYVSTGVRSTPENGEYKTTWLRSGGLDVKYGINESFTLDATLIPDFGQVVSDNLVNNLTPYEVKFDEYRPFFTEGTEIFNKGGLFYSRRIGAVPSGFYAADTADNNPNIEIIRNPAKTTLYNGLKFSGRTKKKLGIGVFNAITAPMYATLKDKTTGEKEKFQTELLANYNIIVLDQALRGRSYITFTNTNVIRNGEGRDANVSGLDFSFYDRKNIFNIRGFGHYSQIVNPSSSNGYNTSLRAGKVSGRFQYYLQNVILSRYYDPNDLGYLSAANQVISSGAISYNQYTPTNNFLNYTYSLKATYRQLYKPNAFVDFTLEAMGMWTFKNFWVTSVNLSYLPDQHDYFVLGNSFSAYARRPAYGFINIIGNTDNRKKLLFNYNLLLSNFFNTPGKKYHVAEAGVRYRFSNKLTMELSHRHEGETNYIINSGNEPNGQPVIGFANFKDVTSIFSGIYNFTPRINLTVRVRHYWSNVIFNGFANVDNKGYPVMRPFMPGHDENINIFNADAFFTWDFRLGSRLILGYKNALGDDEGLNTALFKNYIDNFTRTFSLDHGHEVTLRFIYFLDYEQLRRKNH